MTPDQILNNMFTQAVSGITGGIVTDLSTAIVALIAILLVITGLRALLDVFFESRAKDNLKRNVESTGGNWDNYVEKHNLKRAERRWSKYDQEL